MGENGLGKLRHGGRRQGFDDEITFTRQFLEAHIRQVEFVCCQIAKRVERVAVYTFDQRFGDGRAEGSGSGDADFYGVFC